MCCYMLVKKFASVCCRHLHVFGLILLFPTMTSKRKRNQNDGENEGKAAKKIKTEKKADKTKKDLFSDLAIAFAGEDGAALSLAEALLASGCNVCLWCPAEGMAFRSDDPEQIADHWQEKHRCKTCWTIGHDKALASHVADKHGVSGKTENKMEQRIARSIKKQIPLIAKLSKRLKSIGDQMWGLETSCPELAMACVLRGTPCKYEGPPVIRKACFVCDKHGNDDDPIHSLLFEYSINGEEMDHITYLHESCMDAELERFFRGD